MKNCEEENEELKNKIINLQNQINELKQGLMPFARSSYLYDMNDCWPDDKRISNAPITYGDLRMARHLIRKEF